MQYPTYDIQTYDKIEQLGTKEKFWFYAKHDSISRLCKFGRPGTGENWAEKATSEIASLLDIPCAEYDFAYWFERECVVSPNFVPEYGRLIHGNELLVNLINRNYPKDQRYRVTEYKLSTVEKLFKSLSRAINLPLGYTPHKHVNSPIDMFLAYLMFDCLIANPDRHHENWGIILDSKNQTYNLAPTYDHASGLGCRISDDERKNRLSTKDKRYSVKTFIQRAKTPIYNNRYNRLTTLDAFIKLARRNKRAANFWLNKLNIIDDKILNTIFDKIPSRIISHAAIEFAISIIKENKIRLLKSKEKLTV